jgi:hypothetical protein
MLSLLPVLLSAPGMAAGPFLPPSAVVIELPAETSPADRGHEPHRLVAATLAVTLGAFGAHRLYFGTDAKVPVIYGITFGGFGVLVLIDLAHILFDKDLAPYHANNKVFMWGKAPAETLTPP